MFSRKNGVWKRSTSSLMISLVLILVVLVYSLSFFPIILSQFKYIEEKRFSGLEDTHNKGRTLSGVKDVTLPLQHDRLNILFLTHAFNYESSLDRTFFNQFDAANRHPYIEAELWGMGFPSYNFQKTLRENIIQRYGSPTYFDIIYLSGLEYTHEVKEISAEVAILVRFDDCSEMRCAPFIEDNNASIIMFSFAYEMLNYIEYSTEKLLVHSPASADPSIFYKEVDADRDIDILVVGSEDPITYPLVDRVKSLIINGEIEGEIRPHPGSFFWEWDDSYWKHYQGPNIERVQLADQQMKDYASLAQRAKICIVSSGVYKYAKMKYIEMAQAGCLIVGDVPLDRESEFKQYVVEINENDEDETIIDTLWYWLEQEDERLERARIGQNIALQYNNNQFANSLVKYHNLWVMKQYGMFLEHPFRVGCAARNLQQARMQNTRCAL